MSIFKGFSAFPLTPTDGAGRINTGELSELLERLVDTKVDSIGLLGSTGGYAYLKRDERKRALGAAVETVAGRIPLIVGVGSMRTDEVQALTRDAQEAGADGLLLAPVSYLSLLEEEAFQHYKTVAETSELPLCIYNNPSTTHFTFSLSLLQRLSHLPTVTAAKMPLPKDGDFALEMESLSQGAADDFMIGYSADWGCAEAMLSGAAAWYSAMGGLLPIPFMKLCRAAQAGDRIEVQRLDAYFTPLWALLKEFGSMRVAYTAANLMGLTKAEPHRPILPLSAQHQERVTYALASLEPLGRV